MKQHSIVICQKKGWTINSKVNQTANNKLSDFVFLKILIEIAEILTGFAKILAKRLKFLDNEPKHKVRKLKQKVKRLNQVFNSP